MAKTLELNRSSLYVKPAELTIEAIELRLKIIDIKTHYKGYGYRRVTAQLRREGLSINHKKVYRLMKIIGLFCPKRTPRKKLESVIKSTYLTSRLGINLIREIRIDRPFQVVHTDFTEIITRGGKFHLIVYICNYTKYVINWAISKRMTTPVVINCIKPVLKAMKPNSYLHHDQGSVYISNQYVDLLLRAKMYISYSEIATPSDNGEVESFFGRFKNEWSDEYLNAQNLRQLKKIITKAITYYNHDRIHTSINDIPSHFLSIRISG